jgi:acetoin utilization protein AcuB
MLVENVMTRNVITVAKDTPVSEAQRIMKEHNFRRLPVVDKRGRLVGLVTEPRLERVKPRTSTPLLWQITYLLSHTNASDVMRKDVVTVKPTDTVEQAVAKAQLKRVGTLIVIDQNKIVGICTTNDFFYKIVNPTLGLGESGIRIQVPGGGGNESIEKIVACVNKLGIEIKVLWAITSPVTQKKDIILHLEAEDGDNIIRELEKINCQASILPR